MRIISKFKDYYDSAICNYFCSDIPTLFKREPIEYEHGFKKHREYYSFFNYRGFNYRSIYSNITIIGFCGKCYYAFSIDKENHLGQYEVFINKDNNVEQIINEYIDTIENNRLKKNISKDSKSLIQHVESKINFLNEHYKIDDELFIKYKTPYFKLKIYQEKQIVISNFNKLKDYKFYRVFNANEAHQEIEMYLNSVLTNNEEVPQITDSKTLIISKGFDLKTSFRHPIK